MGRLRRRIASIVAVLVLVALGTACGKSGPSTSASNTTAAPAATTTTAGAPSSGDALTIKSFKFDPNPLTVKVGTTVTITNDDGTNHTVTADDGSFDTGPFDSGSKTITLTKAGTFPFHCNIHDFMKGVIQVISS